jgi:hypothetical protein
MSGGPHRIWEQDRQGRAPSEWERARVRKGKTLADLSGDTDYSIAALHHLEVHDRGSATMRRKGAGHRGRSRPRVGRRPARTVHRREFVVKPWRRYPRCRETKGVVPFICVYCKFEVRR